MAAQAKHLRPVNEPEDLTPVVPTPPGSSTRPAPFVGEQLDRYRLVSPLAQGGMAEVFLAAQEVGPFTHRPVVIKRLYAHLAGDSNLVQMFLDEAKLHCRLEHPHIVRIFEAGVIDGNCCIAMEYLEGQTLAVLLKHAHEQGSMTPTLAIEIVDSILSGLHYSHEARDDDGRSLEIVHRDVSPHNVFITNEGQVKLLDFGVAKARTHEFTTRAGIVKGKPGYIAPEQARAERVDRRADVWSAGVLLWEALTGRRLFKADTEAASAMLTLTARVEPPSAIRPDIPPELDAIVARALERNVQKRYPTAFDMRMDLQGVFPWSSRDTNGLARLMQTTFAEAIVEQRRLVSVLMALSDSTPPSGRPSVPARSVPPPPAPARSIPPPPLPPRSKRSAITELPPIPEPSRGGRNGAVFVAAFAVSFAVVIGAWLLLAPPAPSPPATVSAPAVRATQPPAPAARATQPPAPVAPPPAAPVAVQAPTARTEPAAPPLALRPRAPLDATRPARPLASAAPVAPPTPASVPRADATSSAKEAPSEAFGWLTLDTTPWSSVSAGGRTLGQTPLIRTRLPAGVHTLVLKNPELGLETTYIVTVENGKTVSKRIGLE